MKSNTPQRPEAAPLGPTDDQREVAKSRMQEAIMDWLDVRIDEVFGTADENIETPFGARIGWDDLDEIREQIFGCLENDLRDLLGEYIQEILEDALTGEAEGGDEATPKPDADGKGTL